MLHSYRYKDGVVTYHSWHEREVGRSTAGDWYDATFPAPGGGWNTSPEFKTERQAKRWITKQMKEVPA